jgi:hypothetical protein
MGQYEPNPDGKFQCTVCDYGHGPGNGKSRQSVSKHFKKAHKTPQDRPKDPEPSQDTLETIEAQEDPLIERESISFTMNEEPTWMTAGILETGDEPIRPSPMSSPVKGFLKSLQKEQEAGPKRKKSAKERAAWMKQQGRMVRWAYVCVDRLVVWWGRGVLEEPDWDISRSEDEWVLLENATTAWMDHHNLSMPVNPDVVFIATLGSAYVPPIRHVVKNGKRKAISWKNPIKGFFARRRLKRIERAREKGEFVNEPGSV